MADEEIDSTVFIVVGASLRAERMDRPLAYRMCDTVTEQFRNGVDGSDGPVDLDCQVISDVWYLNSERLRARPTISLGGPGVNHLSNYLMSRLETVLSIDNVLLIQMNSGSDPPQCSVWGMDHETNVEAMETFISKGYLDRFLQACVLM